jgi:hypothetical protein
MVDASSVDIGGVRFLGGSKKAKVHLSFVLKYLRPPSALHFGDALFAAFIATTRWAICAVLCVCCFSEIGYAIVRPLHIDVVELIARPCSVHKKPS